ncbi:hypothetical protein ACA910_004176 [Epithemia clementina (nom. ined.)]
MFAGAPFSKLVAAFTVIAYLSMHTKHNSWSVFEFDATKIRERGEGFRYFTSKMTFSSTSELVVGTLLLTYLMRKFEREMGTRKIAFFCSFINLATITSESLLLVHSAYPSLAISSTTAAASASSFYNLKYMGPYPIMGALFSLYHRYTPRLHPRFFSVFGIHFSEKIFHYAWLMQIAMSNGWNSTYAIGIGWLFSLCYEFVPYLGQLDVPDRVASFLGGLSSRFFVDPPPRILAPLSASNNINNNNHRNGGRSLHRSQAAAAAATAAGGLRPTTAHQRQQPIAADPAAIEQLTHMGFPRPQVVEALQSTNNDVHRAAERLLMQQGTQ